MSDDFVFDPSKLGERPPNPFDPLPNGKYVVVLDKAERKTLKNADNGSRLACEFTITRGEHEHRPQIQPVSGGDRRSNVRAVVPPRQHRQQQRDHHRREGRQPR